MLHLDENKLREKKLQSIIKKKNNYHTNQYKQQQSSFNKVNLNDNLGELIKIKNF